MLLFTLQKAGVWEYTWNISEYNTSVLCVDPLRWSCVWWDAVNGTNKTLGILFCDHCSSQLCNYRLPLHTLTTGVAYPVTLKIICLYQFIKICFAWPVGLAKHNRMIEMCLIGTDGLESNNYLCLLIVICLLLFSQLPCTQKGGPRGCGNIVIKLDDRN